MTKESMIYTVILAGGSGYRLWPLSRKKFPKQFLKVDSENSLLQETVLRNKSFTDQYILITNNDYRFTVDQQMKEVYQEEYRMLLEGAGRNTAPAIALACLCTKEDDIVSVVPCDHKIMNQKAYRKALDEGYTLAKQGYLVTFGIEPDRPETGFGYINCQGNNVISFKEKPHFEDALRYIQEKDYLWNSGIFMFQSGVFLNELKKYREDIFNASKAVSAETPANKSVLNYTKKSMESIPADSIDYAIMEKSSLVKVVKAEYLWDDIGSFESFDRYLKKDEHGNTLETNTIYRNSENMMVFNDTPNKLIVANEIKDMVVINTVDALYLSQKGKSHQIKEIISKNEEEFAGFFLDNIRSHTPWGYYEVVVREPHYQVKRMTVFPGCRMSLQKHVYKSEHWTVVRGTATVTIGDEKTKLEENQGAYIRIGQVHRLENDTEQEIVIIEVALGEKVSEDDIIRIEDDYGRV